MDGHARHWRLKGIAGAIAVAVSVASCAVPETPLATDKPTFVSLNPCLDAILVEVAQPDQILALSHYSHDQGSTSMDVEVANEFAVTGGTAEEIIALSPDIVLASTFIAPATRSALERAGLRVATFGSAGTLQASIDQIHALAELAGESAAGKAMADSLATKLPLDPAPQISALLWQPGQIVAGKASLVAKHLEWAGLANHAEEMGLSQADHVSLESILAEPPDILLIAGESAGHSHPALENLHDTLVAQFPPKLLYCAGPTIPKARAHLAQIRAEFERGQLQETGS